MGFDVSDELRATAYHEAGHVVAALQGGIPFRRVSIKPEQDMAGFVELGAFILNIQNELKEAEKLSPVSKEKVENYAIFCVSGYWAEHHHKRLLLGRALTDDEMNMLFSGSRHDFADFSRIAEYYHIKDVIDDLVIQTYEQYIKAKTRCLITDRRWEIVECVAKNLLICEEMTYAEVRNAIRRPGGA